MNRFIPLPEALPRISSSYSGVVPITLFTIPAECGGNCLYCPQSPGIPRSYVPNSSLIRAKKLRFDPRVQLRQSLQKFLEDTNGSNPIPLEVIILGGSFCSFSREYRKSFMSDIYEEISSISNCEKRTPCNVLFKISILTIECRPDQITDEECLFLRTIGVSKVELGVQHLDNGVLEENRRNCNCSSIREASKTLRNHGFKVGYHVMLGLPGSTEDLDRKMLEHDLWLPEYSPDFLKVYPCSILKDKAMQPFLHCLLDKGDWTPLPRSGVKELLKALWQNTPPHVRISRVGRMFPEHFQINESFRGIRSEESEYCRCIRCREAGRNAKSIPDDWKESNRIRESQTGQEWICEILVSGNILLGLARVHFRSQKAAIIREIHVYGKATPIGNRDFIQGNGIGKKLLRACEEQAVKQGCTILLVTAAFGARGFFFKRGYKLREDCFLGKSLRA